MIYAPQKSTQKCMDRPFKVGRGNHRQNPSLGGVKVVKVQGGGGFRRRRQSQAEKERLKNRRYEFYAEKEN